jgi:TPR repeat protein
VRIHRLAIGLALGALVACQTVPQPRDYDALARAADAGEDVAPMALRDAFLASPDFNDRMEKLAPLEQQALQQMVDEPLRLGATGSAILDIYFGSLAGHLALAKFYDHLGESDSAAVHHQWLERIGAAIERDADGTRAAPYVVVSASEALAYLRSRDITSVGSMYHSAGDIEFMLIVAGRGSADKGLSTSYFDLSLAYAAVAKTLANPDEPGLNPGTLIGSLAHRDDSAAQTAIGAYLMAQRRYPDAVNWLRAATRTGNVIANLMLARVYQIQAREAPEDDAETLLQFALEQYLHAIALGSDEAMFALATLYLDGIYGEDNLQSGVTLLQQSAALGNADALLWLGHFYSDGTNVDQNDDLAADNFRRGAEAGDARARLSYARFLLDRSDTRPFDPQALQWLAEEAKDKDPEAMILMGNLSARGLGVSQSFRKALTWFKSAVAASPEDANIVNEVAWTLTVSHFDGLRRPQYALEIMNRIMAADSDARQNPAYLDTWAAAHAANGDFDRARAVQREAIAAAETQQQGEVVDVLREHLEKFEQGEVIIDPVP